MTAKYQIIRKINETYGLELTADTCWTTDELTSQYNVTSFAYGFCFAEKDGTKYVFDFVHMPRLYFNRREV